MGLFGLDLALPAVAGGRRDLLVVEDLWDALLLHADGWAAVGAIGNSPAEVGPRRWERLDELGIHRVTLVVDSFHESHEAATAAIRQAACSRRSPAIYVLPPAAVHGAWQSWQQGRAAQPEILEKLLAAQRIHGFHYLALGLIALAQGRRPVDRRLRRTALAEGRKFFATAHQRNVPQLETFFLPPLLEALGLTWADRGHGTTPGWRIRPPPTATSGTNRLSWKTKPRPTALRVEIAGPANTVSTAHRHVASEYCDFHQCERIVCLCWD